MPPHPADSARREFLAGCREWPICKPACECGAKLDVPVFRFLKDALSRAYGKEWYDELEKVYAAWSTSEHSRKPARGAKR